MEHLGPDAQRAALYVYPVGVGIPKRKPDPAPEEEETEAPPIDPDPVSMHLEELSRSHGNSGRVPRSKRDPYVKKV
jgi:hypothetical protein